MTPNENRSSSRCKRDCGLRRSGCQSAFALLSHLLPPSPPPSHAIVQDVGLIRYRFRLTWKRRKKAFSNKIWPHCEFNACRGLETTVLHPAWRLRGLWGGSSELQLSLLSDPGSLQGAIKPPDGKFIIDSDLSLSLLTSKSEPGRVCVCVRGCKDSPSGVFALVSLPPFSVCARLTLQTRIKSEGSLTSFGVWVLASLSLSIPRICLASLCCAHMPRNAGACARTSTCLCFCNSHRKQKQQDGLFLQMEAKR